MHGAYEMYLPYIDEDLRHVIVSPYYCMQLVKLFCVVNILFASVKMYVR